MAEASFGGASKLGQSILGPLEKRFVAAGVGHVPRGVETHHLTLLTFVWSLAVVAFGCLARRNLAWLHMVSLMILLQYLSDLFDGAVGRARNTGLVKWGFFMDHFLDYVFLCSIIIAYSLVAPPGLEFHFMLLLGLTGGFMVLSFLSFAATNEFQIYFMGVGPTEARIVFIVVNALIAAAGTERFTTMVPIVNAVCTVGLTFLAFRTHRRLWAVDMAAKDAAT